MVALDHHEKLLPKLRKIKGHAHTHAHIYPMLLQKTYLYILWYAIKINKLQNAYLHPKLCARNEK